MGFRRNRTAAADSDDPTAVLEKAYEMANDLLPLLAAARAALEVVESELDKCNTEEVSDAG